MSFAGLLPLAGFSPASLETAINWLEKRLFKKE
jgi:hypothetical protein